VKQFHCFGLGLLLVVLSGLLMMLPTLAIAITVTPEKVEFPSLEDVNPTKLVGYLYKPATLDEKAPMPAFVLMHGCSGMIDAKGQIRAGVSFWAERLVEKGYVALLVDSFNPRGHKEVCTQSERPILEDRERPRDAYGGLQYLFSLPFVAKDRVFLMGFSHGATGTLYAVNDSGKHWKAAQRAGIRFAAALAFYPGCIAANRNSLKPAVPLAIFIGAADDWTPAPPCEALISSAKSAGRAAEIYQYPGAYHGFDVPGTSVRFRTDIRNRANPKLGNGVHVGGDDVARVAATKDVDAYLEKQLKPVLRQAPP